MNATSLSALLAIGALCVAAPGHGQEVIDIEATATFEASPDPVPSELIIRHPWVKSIARVDPPEITDRQELMLNRLELARPWVQLLSDEELNEDWSQPTCRDTRDRGLCSLRWRKTDAFSGARSRLEDFSTGVKSRLVGKALAKHLEVDIDSSPEIKFEWEFD